MRYSTAKSRLHLLRLLTVLRGPSLPNEIWQLFARFNASFYFVDTEFGAEENEECQDFTPLANEFCMPQRYRKAGFHFMALWSEARYFVSDELLRGSFPSDRIFSFPSDEFPNFLSQQARVSYDVRGRARYSEFKLSEFSNCWSLFAPGRNPIIASFSVVFGCARPGELLPFIVRVEMIARLRVLIWEIRDPFDIRRSASCDIEWQWKILVHNVGESDACRLGRLDIRSIIRYEGFSFVLDVWARLIAGTCFADSLRRDRRLLRVQTYSFEYTDMLPLSFPLCPHNPRKCHIVHTDYTAESNKRDVCYRCTADKRGYYQWAFTI